MASTTATNQCPNCTGALKFSPETGKLVCEFCNSSFTHEEIDALIAAKLEKASAAFEAEHARDDAPQPSDSDSRPDAPAAGDKAAGDQSADDKPAGAPSVKPAGAKPAGTPSAKPEHAEYKKTTWDASTIDEDWGEDADNLVTYSCASCGGEIICEAATAATQCPYCGNSTVVPGQFSVGYKPNYVIPFKMTKPQAEEALKRHYRGKIFLPSEFSDKNQIKKLQGTYVPFWLFNGDCDAKVTFDCKKSSETRDGDYLVTTTEHYKVVRHGTVPFDKIPVDASTKMPDDLMDSLEPFNYSELIPFTPSVFAGFIADKYDVEPSSCAKRADDRCADTVLAMLKGDIHGYDCITVTNRDIKMKNARIDYALLPVYTMKTQFEEKSYLFAMNGQTGKLVGDLPVSKKKFWTFCAALAVALGAGLFALGVSGSIADFIWEIIA